MLEPSDKQRSALNDIQGTFALVQFLVIKDQDAFVHYRSSSERTVQKAGGQRTHCVHIDQYLAGGEMQYQVITVDLFPSNKAAQLAFDGVNTERQSALLDIYVLIVRPVGKLPGIAKALGFLAPILSRLLGTVSEREITGFAELANPEKGPVPETVAVMKEHDQTTSFYMMNLNKYYPSAQYNNGDDISGEQAYSRYASRIAPYLISVGGYPDILGHTVGVFVGDESSTLNDDWSDFAMVYYPSRQKFMRLMTNSPKQGVLHRDAGLQRAVLMPSTIIP
ncbi:MAG: hypothetical protein ACERKY_07915 [Anaerolineales bacterium]